MKKLLLLTFIIGQFVLTQSSWAQGTSVVEKFLESFSGTSSSDPFNYGKNSAQNEFSQQEKEDLREKIIADPPVAPPEKLHFLGQKKSLTNWGSIDLDTFLSYKDWKFLSAEKDKNPEWEKILRERSLTEMTGRVYQCIGKCRVTRGEGFFYATHRTNIYEGDEIETLEDSFLWIFLFDGTMIRLSPQSSITLNEFNVGIEENFINARVNFGNVVWLSRLESFYEEENMRETDVIFFPFAEYLAIPKQDQKKYEEKNLDLLLGESLTHINHTKDLNLWIQENNKMTKKKKTYSFITMPNMTLMGYSPNVEIVSLLGGETYFKSRSFNKLLLAKEVDVEAEAQIEQIKEELQFALRGLENKALTTLEDDIWMSVDAKGESSSPKEDTTQLDVGEFITKRPTRIFIGREIFLKNYSKFVFSGESDPLKFAKEHGYRLWGKMQSVDQKHDDLELRLVFLKEYTRRIETTNLESNERWKKRMESRGKKIENMVYGDYFYKKAMDKYYQNGEKGKDVITQKDLENDLNSTKKTIWKRMNGIR